MPTHETICCGDSVTTFAVQIPEPGERTRCNGCGQVQMIDEQDPNGEWTIWTPDHDLIEALTGWA